MAGDRVQASPSTVSRMIPFGLIWRFWIHWALRIDASVYLASPVVSARNAESLVQYQYVEIYTKDLENIRHIEPVSRATSTRESITYENSCCSPSRDGVNSCTVCRGLLWSNLVHSRICNDGRTQNTPPAIDSPKHVPAIGKSLFGWVPEAASATDTTLQRHYEMRVISLKGLPTIPRHGSK